MANLQELALKHPDQFLSKHVFNGLYVDEFKFGPGASGNLGSNMISQYIVVPAQTRKGGLKPMKDANELAIHLNCTVTASGLQNHTIPIHVEQFHVTARSIDNQKDIDKDGPSASETAPKSIHMNINTGWGKEANLKALAAEVGINDDQTLHVEMKTKQGYNNAYMLGLVKEFKAKVELRIHHDLGANVVVKWGGDKTFPA